MASLTVSPDPVTQNTEYTITVTGLEPSTEYGWVLHQQQSGQIDWDGIISSDANGTATQVVVAPWQGMGIWAPGDVTVNVKKYAGTGFRTQGGPVASGSFTVAAA